MVHAVHENPFIAQFPSAIGAVEPAPTPFIARLIVTRKYTPVLPYDRGSIFSP